VLARCATFSDLPPEVFDPIVERLRERTYDAGEALIRQGDPGDGLHVMVSGTAVVSLWQPAAPLNPSQTSASGAGGGPGATASKNIAVFGPGDVVGEMALVTSEPRSADVVATSPVRALWFSAALFENLAVRYPELGVVITNLVAKRLGETSLDGLVGKSIGGYRIVRSVGRGEMAVVYKALGPPSLPEHEQPASERVALKMMSHRLLYERGAAARFQRETATLMRPNHPNVSRVYACFPAFRTSFIAMEFCDGPDLSRLHERHSVRSMYRKTVAARLAVGERLDGAPGAFAYE
jgi:CRP-like cAMP-binding protein